MHNQWAAPENFGAPNITPIPNNNSQMTFFSPDISARFARSGFMLLALSVVVVALSSCRTSEGFGRDLQKLGTKIENEAIIRQ